MLTSMYLDGYKMDKYLIMLGLSLLIYWRHYIFTLRLLKMTGSNG